MKIHILNIGSRARVAEQRGFFLFSTLINDVAPSDIVVFATEQNNSRVLAVKVEHVVHQEPGLAPNVGIVSFKPFAEYDMTGPEPVTGGAMKNSWNKGVAAFKDGAELASDSYPGDKHGAPYTVWLKGFVWATLAKQLR